MATPHHRFIVNTEGEARGARHAEALLKRADAQIAELREENETFRVALKARSLKIEGKALNEARAEIATLKAKLATAESRLAVLEKSKEDVARYKKVNQDLMAHIAAHASKE